MKRHLTYAFVCIFFAGTIVAQTRQHKIVFDFTKNDTASFSMIMRHAKNILNAAPGSQVEVVCHGPGLDLLMTAKTSVAKDIEELNGKFNVVFAACEATMKRRQVDKSQLLPAASTVPLANLEISMKQQEGWSYIKSGY